MTIMRTPKVITQSAKDEDCTLQIPGVCNYNPETTVYCHFPDGRGGSNKLTGPLNGGYGCSKCHDVIDGRVYWFSHERAVEKEFYMRRAMNRTINRLINKGLIQVKGLK